MSDDFGDSHDKEFSAETLFALAAENKVGTLEKHLNIAPNLAESKNEQGIRLLMWAMYHRQAEAAAVIYQYLCNPEPGEIIALNDLLKLKQLLERDPEQINHFSTDGFTLLHYACFFGHIECTHFLIELGAKLDVAAKNPSKVYPLHSALAAQSPKVVKALLDFGADANVQQHGGYTALMSAASHNNLELIDLLLAHQADIALVDDFGKCAYDHGKEKGFDIAPIKAAN